MLVFIMVGVVIGMMLSWKAFQAAVGPSRASQIQRRRYYVYTRPDPSGEGTQVVMGRRRLLIGADEQVVRRVARDRKKSKNPDVPYDQQLALALAETRSEVSANNASLRGSK